MQSCTFFLKKSKRVFRTVESRNVVGYNCELCVANTAISGLRIESGDASSLCKEVAERSG